MEHTSGGLSEAIGTVAALVSGALDQPGLSLSNDRHGTMHIKGRLPIGDGEELAAVLNAHAESAWKRHVDEVGPDTGPKDKSLLLADALMAVARAHQARREAPGHGGDRPRVKILLSLKDLICGLGDMMLGSGCGVTATEARRLACDCDLIPVVLDAEGMPLDVGRQHRLVPPSMRVAVVARDRGCGLPQVTPPRGYDPDRAVLHHARFTVMCR